MEDRKLGLAGVASVVALLVGTSLAFAGGRPSLTFSSTQSEIANGIADPVSPLAWAGSYLELVGAGLFLVFAVWACVRLGGGVLGAIGQMTAAVNTSVTVVSLGILDAAQYMQGHGLRLPEATALFKLGSALHVTTWFLSVFFLIALAPLALRAGHRRLGWAAAAIAALWLVVIPLSPDGFAQMMVFPWFAWIVAAGFVVGRVRAG